jgi:nuclease-like protein
MGGRASESALRKPGQHARARGLELAFRPVLIGCAGLLVMATAWAVLGLRGLPLALVELVALGVMLGANHLYSAQSDRWLRGAEGERAVGGVLAQLEDEGWKALHDISLGRGNVDHVLIGPGGIFTIETKSHPGRIGVDRIDPKMLKQAYAEKKLLERITGLKVQPLLVQPSVPRGTRPRTAPRRNGSPRPDAQALLLTPQANPRSNQSDSVYQRLVKSLHALLASKPAQHAKHFATFDRTMRPS